MNKEEHEHQFTGVFIPASVVLNPDLISTDKLLLAEIDALRGKDNAGCWASDDYLGTHLHITAAGGKKAVKRLKDLGMIKTIKTDGRRRWLKVIWPDFIRADGYSSIELMDTPVSSSRIPQYPLKIRDKEKTKEEKPLTPFSGELQSAWEAWCRHRKQIHKSMSDETIARQIATLNKLGADRAVAAIENSIEKGYTGIFEDKSSTFKMTTKLLTNEDYENEARELAARNGV